MKVPEHTELSALGTKSVILTVCAVLQSIQCPVEIFEYGIEFSPFNSICVAEICSWSTLRSAPIFINWRRWRRESRFPKPISGLTASVWSSFRSSSKVKTSSVVWRASQQHNLSKGESPNDKLHKSEIQKSRLSKRRETESRKQTKKRKPSAETSKGTTPFLCRMNNPCLSR